MPRGGPHLSKCGLWLRKTNEVCLSIYWWLLCASWDACGSCGNSCQTQEGLPFLGTVWDKFSEQLTQKPRTWQCHIPRTPGTSYAFLCLASLKHIDTAIHEFRVEAQPQPGSAQSAVLAWPSTWCTEAPPGHVVVPCQHVRLETPKNLKHGNNLDTARFEDASRSFKGKPTTTQFSFCHQFTSLPYFIQYTKCNKNHLFGVGGVGVVLGSTQFQCAKIHIHGRKENRYWVAESPMMVWSENQQLALTTHADSSDQAAPKSLLSPSTSSPAHIRWCTPSEPHRFYSFQSCILGNE